MKFHSRGYRQCPRDKLLHRARARPKTVESLYPTSSLPWKGDYGQEISLMMAGVEEHPWARGHVGNPRTLSDDWGEEGVDGS